MPLDAASQFVNDLVVGGRGDQAAPTDPTTLRDAWRTMFAALPPLEMTCEMTELSVAGRPALLLTPATQTTALLVWLHGGGWVIGAPDLSLGETDSLANLANTKVLSLDYRMAPEHPFPAAYDDSIAAVQWVIDHADELEDVEFDDPPPRTSPERTHKPQTRPQPKREPKPQQQGQPQPRPAAAPDDERADDGEDGESSPPSEHSKRRRRRRRRPRGGPRTPDQNSSEDSPE